MDCWLGGAAVALATLTIAGALDWLHREVDPELWGPALAVAVPLGACQVARTPGGPVFLVAGLLLWVATLGLYLSGLLGGADMIATLLIAIALPVPPRPGQGLLGLLPPVLPVMLSANLAGLAYKVLQIRRALRRGARLRGLSVEIGRDELARDPGMRWWVPSSARVEEEWSWDLASLPGRVEASPGSPMVTMLALALWAYVLLSLLA